MKIAKNKKAVILLSGGLDSATCLYMAKNQGFKLIALTFDYGQRHLVELEYANKLAYSIKLYERLMIPLDLTIIGSSSLTENIKMPKNRKNIDKKTKIPNTYVPARNLIFLSIATALAEARNCNHIFIGINSLDYSGYPDCRPDFIKSFEKTITLGTKAGIERKNIQIHTPLINLSKKEIIKKAIENKVPLELTWSCYDPQKITKDEFSPCFNCDSCLLRKKGFKDAKIHDPWELRKFEQ
ncbi:MAG: 7-cyano-7-deazaguanine synthase QueC [Spirochaetia bacterium]|nr:7-cyano-7-deazaguanine synthase QueC [Spirochaetia bacterium]